MPGIKNLSNKNFLQAFKVMDRIIQNNNPFFMIVWVGSILAMIITLILGINQINGIDLVILIVASLFYLLAVQLPTVLFNIPLNNKIQSIDLETLSDDALGLIRGDFETRWNRWNLFRTVISILVSALLLTLLIKL